MDPMVRDFCAQNLQPLQFLRGPMNPSRAHLEDLALVAGPCHVRKHVCEQVRVGQHDAGAIPFLECSRLQRDLVHLHPIQGLGISSFILSGWI